MNSDHNPGGAEDGTSQEYPDRVGKSVVVDAQGKPYTHTRRAYHKVKQLQKFLGDHVQPRDRLMIVLTAIIAISTVAQFRLASRSAKTSGDQADKLIAAASQVGDSSDRFAESAEGINDGISQAVEKLNLQAGALKNNSDQTTRLATATERANANIVDADRPWLGGVLSVSAFDVGSKPVLTYSFQNSGKRPARIESMDSIAFVAPVFPSTVDERLTFQHFSTYTGTRSTGVIVPGQTFGNPKVQQPIMTQQGMNLIKNGDVIYFAIARIEYSDIRTNQRYWTHLCVQYLPTKDAGEWQNCDQYNDAN